MQDYALIIMIMSGPDDGQKIYLSHRDGKGQVSVDGIWSLVFGRRDECDINIPFDTQISRQHAILRVLPDDVFWLIDVGSLNGTFVGETRVEQPTLLHRGQLFRLGRTWMRVQPEVGERNGYD
ncbi:MAG: FHA domain-containing protein [Chloroflexi bacterium]|nr:FHA domain-containing protein [Chloroflexota bacterium]